MKNQSYYVSYLSWKPGSCVPSGLTRVVVLLLVKPPIRYVPMPVPGDDDDDDDEVPGVQEE